MSEASKQRAIIVFNKGFTDEDYRKIPNDFVGEIIIHGDLNCSTELIINADLWVFGNISLLLEECCENLIVNGDCFCTGYVDLCNISVMGNFICDKYIKSADITVANSLIVKDNIEAYMSSIIVGEDFVCNGVDSGNVNVGGNFTSNNKVDLDDLTVNGNIECTCIDAVDVRVAGKIKCGEFKAVSLCTCE